MLWTRALRELEGSHGLLGKLANSQTRVRLAGLMYVFEHAVIYVHHDQDSRLNRRARAGTTLNKPGVSITGIMASSCLPHRPWQLRAVVLLFRLFELYIVWTTVLLGAQRCEPGLVGMLSPNNRISMGPPCYAHRCLQFIVADGGGAPGTCMGLGGYDCALHDDGQHAPHAHGQMSGTRRASARSAPQPTMGSASSGAAANVSSMAGGATSGSGAQVLLHPWLAFSDARVEDAFSRSRRGTVQLVDKGYATLFLVAGFFDTFAARYFLHSVFYVTWVLRTLAHAAVIALITRAPEWYHTHRDVLITLVKISHLAHPVSTAGECSQRSVEEALLPGRRAATRLGGVAPADRCRGTQWLRLAPGPLTARAHARFASTLPVQPAKQNDATLQLLMTPTAFPHAPHPHMQGATFWYPPQTRTSVRAFFMKMLFQGPIVVKIMDILFLAQSLVTHLAVHTLAILVVVFIYIPFADAAYYRGAGSEATPAEAIYMALDTAHPATFMAGGVCPAHAAWAVFVFFHVTLGWVMPLVAGYWLELRARAAFAHGQLGAPALMTHLSWLAPAEERYSDARGDASSDAGSDDGGRDRGAAAPDEQAPLMPQPSLPQPIEAGALASMIAYSVPALLCGMAALWEVTALCTYM